MMLHLKRWLTPPVFLDDEDQTRRASVLNVALITTLALMAFVFVGNMLGSRTPLIVSVADAAVFIVCLILRRWMQLGRVHLASAALIGMGLASVTVAAATLGTIRAPSTAVYMLIVIGGGLLFDIGGIVVTTALSSLAVLGLIVAQNAELLPRPDYTVTITQWITYTALFGLSGGLTFVALRSTRQALQQADREIAERKRVEAALRESEQKFRSFVEQSSEGFTLVDEQGAVLEWNRAREQMTGVTRDRVIGRPFWDVQQEMLPPEERSDEVYERRRQTIQDALRTGESYLFGRTLEAHLMRPDGEHRFSQQTVFPIKTDQGYRIGSVSRDVTERRRAEEALRESEVNLNRAQAVAHVGSWQLDIPSNTVRWSAETYHMFGVSMETKLTVEDFYTYVHPADREDVARAWQAAVHGAPYDIEHRIVVGGETKWVRERAEVEFDAAGRAVSGIGTVQDITDRKRADETLRETNERLRALIDHSPLAIIMLDPEGVILLWNAAAEKMYGWTAQEAVGKFLPTVSAEKMAEYQAFRNHVNDGYSIPYTEVVRKRKDGSDAFLGLSIAPLRDATGRVYAQMSIAADITERKRAEEALHALNAELERRVAERTHELTDANARLTELDRLKDEFIARISHELRTPLTNIKLYLQLLGHGKPEKYEQYLQTVRAEADKLQQQIDDLLEVSHFQTTRIEPQLIRLDVNRLVQDLFADQLPKAQARGLSLTITAEVKQPDVTTDWALVWQALSRLMANALAYTPRGGAVTLHTDRRSADDQAWLTIEVCDTGPGIAEKDLPYIFEPFYRGAAASDYKTPGTGVGLSIARRTIAQLGGRITVDSQPGQGAAFTIWLRAE